MAVNPSGPYATPFTHKDGKSLRTTRSDMSSLGKGSLGDSIFAIFIPLTQVTLLLGGVLVSKNLTLL